MVRTDVGSKLLASQTLQNVKARRSLENSRRGGRDGETEAKMGYGLPKPKREKKGHKAGLAWLGVWKGLCVYRGLPHLATPIPSSRAEPLALSPGPGHRWQGAEDGGESPSHVPSPLPPQAAAHRLESVSQLPPTVPTLSCCQFVAFPTNPSLLLLLRSKLSRGDRGHEVCGHGALPPTVPTPSSSPGPTGGPSIPPHL